MPFSWVYTVQLRGLQRSQLQLDPYHQQLCHMVLCMVPEEKDTQNTNFMLSVEANAKKKSLSRFTDSCCDITISQSAN